MKILLINTCALEGVVALADGESLVAIETLPARATSEQLLPAIAALFPPPTRAEAILVVNGPGSFTGIRAGLSAAKGLCDAWEVPMLVVSRLALLANALATDSEAVALSEVVALLDAGRGEYYCGVYRGRTQLDEQLLRLDQVESLLAIRPGVSSEERVATTFPGRVKIVEEPGPAEALFFAHDRIASGDWSDPAFLDANYLRRTDAEILERLASVKK